MFEFTYSPDAIALRLLPARSGLLGRLMPGKTPDLDRLTPADRRLAFALADLRTLADSLAEPLEIAGDRITLSHRLAASLDAESAAALGLPPLTDLTLRTDAEGVLGSAGFRLRHQWLRAGQQRMPRRAGAILETDRGPQRLPLWMLDAVVVAEGFTASTDDAAHWEALARFRKALEPGVTMVGDTGAARGSMTDFLQGLEVSLTDRLSISPDVKGDDFEVVPFSSDRLGDNQQPAEAMAELAGADLQQFQRRVRERGALNAFRLGPGRFLVVDRSAAPALQVMAEMQRATPEDRRAFIRNPRARITDAVEARLRGQGGFDELPPAAQEEAVEAASEALFVETEEYTRFSDRVMGVEVYRGNPLKDFNPSGTTWLPETFAAALLERLTELPTPDLQALRDHVQVVADAAEATRSDNGAETALPEVDFEGMPLPATLLTLQLLDARLAERQAAEAPPEDDVVDEPSGPVVLKTAENFDDLTWHAKLKPRRSDMAVAVPSSIRTRLKDHQVESLSWQIEAWKAGLPGVLNADEPGLGKTLQTISFLVWLNEHMKRSPKRGPVLVVAPTSLLENWEQEVTRHVIAPGLGHLIRLYGSATAGRKLAGARGRDTESGEARLDFSDITRAIDQGAGHLTWVLTTYTTLSNYQHSLARIPFTVAVFDEIQNIKNPGTLAANAGRAMNADFRIGLTGTPIENSTTDLWAIMDQIAPGALGSLRDFRKSYAVPDETNMAELYARTFRPNGSAPPMALRRLKETVARDLPAKSRLLHPRAMPKLQAERYEEARVKLSSGGMGAALKMLHHIRSVSVHPALADQLEPTAFIAASGRLSATFDILRRIQSRGERALVFIESLQMQYRFIELAKAEFGLAKIDLINGGTPITKRQAIVNCFQRHLDQDGGFDLLVLGPKAAGTGLTLTAATHVIHLSRWWNPAVEEQCNDRVHRIGQTRPVTVHVPLAIHSGYRAQSFDLLLQSLMQRKRRLASAALWPMGDDDGDVSQLRDILQKAAAAPIGDVIGASMDELFQRDGLKSVGPDSEGAWNCN